MVAATLPDVRNVPLEVLGEGNAAVRELLAWLLPHGGMPRVPVAQFQSSV